MVVSPVRLLPVPAVQGQGKAQGEPAQRADVAESVTAVFARITSGRARPEDFTRYVDLWDTLQARQWRRGAKPAAGR